MSTFSGLSASERTTVKALFRRKVAQPVSLEDRTRVRSCITNLRAIFPLESNLINVLPVSTLEWSSTSYSLGAKRLALVDVEQANAVEFLLAKDMLFERPIFSYVEFMVRAAEALYSMGRPGTALLVAKKSNDALRTYARSQKHFPYIPRPMAPNEEAFRALAAGLTLSFVTGHEIGHLLSNSEGQRTDLEVWASDIYEKHRLEPGRFSGGQYERFLKPECVQKFDTRGVFCGDIILGIKFAERWDHLKSLQVGEAHSDIIGLVALTTAAIEAGIQPDIAGAIVIRLLEFSEMLMSLRRLLPRMPIRGETTNVTYETSTLGFRRFMFVETLQAMRRRELPVPEAISAFWDDISDEFSIELEQVKSSGDLYSVSNRSIHVARAALLLSCNGYLPECPTEAQIIEQWGPMAGNGFFLASCLKVPEKWMRIDSHINWEPTPEMETVPVGYGSAICDIANIVKKRTKTEAASVKVNSFGGLDHHTMLGLVRHPRSQVFARRVNGRWPSKIMKQL